MDLWLAIYDLTQSSFHQRLKHMCMHTHVLIHRYTHTHTESSKIFKNNPRNSYRHLLPIKNCINLWTWKGRNLTGPHHRQRTRGNSRLLRARKVALPPERSILIGFSNTKMSALK